MEVSRRLFLSYVVNFYGGCLLGIAALYKIVARVAVRYVNHVALFALSLYVF